jgi:hypothetical protein
MQHNKIIEYASQETEYTGQTLPNFEHASQDFEHTSKDFQIWQHFRCHSRL